MKYAKRTFVLFVAIFGIMTGFTVFASEIIDTNSNASNVQDSLSDIVSRRRIESQHERNYHKVVSTGFVEVYCDGQFRMSVVPDEAGNKSALADQQMKDSYFRSVRFSIPRSQSGRYTLKVVIVTPVGKWMTLASEKIGDR